MRAAAEVGERALAVDRDRLAGRQIAHDLRLVGLADALVIRGGLVARPHFARDRFVARDDLAHAFFQPFEIAGSEGVVAGEIVIEPVLDDGADGDLDVGPQFLGGLGEHVRGVVAEHLQPLRVARGDDGDAGVGLDGAGKIAQLAIDARGERGPGKARSDVGRDIGAGHRRVVAADRPVGQGDGDGAVHGGAGKWAPRPGLSTAGAGGRYPLRPQNFPLALPWGRGENPCAPSLPGGDAAGVAAEPVRPFAIQAYRVDLAERAVAASARGDELAEPPRAPPPRPRARWRRAGPAGPNPPRRNGARTPRAGSTGPASPDSPRPTVGCFPAATSRGFPAAARPPCRRSRRSSASATG